MRGETFFSTLFEAVRDAIFIQDRATGYILEANRSACEMFGYTLEELRQVGMENFFLRVENPAQDPNNALTEKTANRQVKDKNGRVFTVNVQTLPILFKSQNRLLIILHYDQAETKGAPPEFKDMIEYSTNLFYSHTPDHLVTYVSPQCQTFFDCEPEEARIRWMEGVTDNPINQKGMEATQRAIETGQPQPPYEMELIGKKGRIVWVEVREAPIVKNGKTVAMVGSLTNITHRKKAESEVYRLNAELEQRVMERTAELEVANKELEAFLYSASHDLRAPLRVIDGFLGMLEADYAPELTSGAQELILHVRSNVKKMGQLIQSLLTFSRFNRLPLNKQTVDIQKMVETVLVDHQTEPQERKVEILVGELPPCQADPILLRQVWVNLISNAFKYTRHRTAARIEIGSWDQSGKPVYFIRDNGAGFDPRYASKLFGVFQRLHSEKEFEGSGVGLAIVHRIIQRHGGCVWAESKVDHGAIFYLSL